MKLTLDIPDGLHRQVEACAFLKGQSVSAFLLDAIQDKLATEPHGGEKTAGWQSVFGKARNDDVTQLQQILDDEFCRTDVEEWE